MSQASIYFFSKRLYLSETIQPVDLSLTRSKASYAKEDDNIISGTSVILDLSENTSVWWRNDAAQSK